MIASVCTDRTFHTPMFVLKVEKIEYRFIDVDNSWEKE